jgi:hypothetical protein
VNGVCWSVERGIGVFGSVKATGARRRVRRRLTTDVSTNGNRHVGPASVAPGVAPPSSGQQVCAEMKAVVSWGKWEAATVARLFLSCCGGSR